MSHSEKYQLLSLFFIDLFHLTFFTHFLVQTCTMKSSENPTKVLETCLTRTTTYVLSVSTLKVATRDMKDFSPDQVTICCHISGNNLLCDGFQSWPT